MFKRFFKHVGNGGGKKSVDFLGLGPLRKFRYDITTPGQRAGKYSKYRDPDLPDVLVPTYDPFP